MELKEAVETIKSNWPDERYTILREALMVVLEHLPTTDNSDNEKIIQQSASRCLCEPCTGLRPLHG